MEMNFKKSLLAALIGVSTFAVTAQAAVLNQVLTIPGINEIQDTDVERVLRDGVTITSGDLAVGDIIQSILRFDTVNASGFIDLIDANGGPLPNYYQLTGFSELRVAQIIDDGVNDDGIAGNGIALLVFGSSGNLLDANSLFDLYERGAGDPGFSTAVDPTTGIANVTGQDFIGSIGLGEADDFWTAIAALDLGIIAGATEGSPQAGNGVFGLSMLSNPGGLPILANGIISPIDGNLHDWVGNSSVYQLSNEANAGWTFSSNVSAAFNAVPEPASLALMGLGLVGMGVSMRRRKA